MGWVDGREGRTRRTRDERMWSRDQHFHEEGFYEGRAAHTSIEYESKMVSNNAEMMSALLCYSPCTVLGSISGGTLRVCYATSPFPSPRLEALEQLWDQAKVRSWRGVDSHAL